MGMKNKKEKENVIQEENKQNEAAKAAEEPTNLEDNQTEGAETPSLQDELAAANERYLRLYAEFDNYKRRTSKERVELIQSAGKEVISNLLTVMDDFDRALKMMDSATEVSTVSEGVQLISQKFKKILQQQGLKEMETIGQPFDADFHEAITNIPAPSAEMKGKVIDELEKGYFLNDKVLRYAKVVVGN